MMLIPCTWIDRPSIGDKPTLRQAAFDADTGITYVETAPDVVTVITGNGVQLMFRSSMADWCTKLIEAAADDGLADDEEPET